MTALPPEDAKIIRAMLATYSHTIDVMEDVDAVVNLFTADAAVDFSSVGFPIMNGEQEIRAFYTGLFQSMHMEFHNMANFKITSFDGEEAVAEIYVIGMGQPKDGDLIHVQVKYRWHCIRVGEAWKCRRFTLHPMMPM